MIVSLTLLTVACLAFGLIVGLEKTITQSQFG
jgi:type III secretory pathway component EscS